MFTIFTVQQPADQLPAAEEGGADVDLEHPAPLLGGYLDHRPAVGGDGRVLDQGIRGPEGLLDPVVHGGDVGFAGDVALGGQGLHAAGLGQLVGDGRTVSHVAHRDVRALGGEEAADRPA
jgi:hypothetical protein